MRALYNWAVVVEWVFAAYALFEVVPAVRMKLGAVSGVHVTLVAECLGHNESMCLGVLPFAD
jgi:hypothetical protein